MSIQAVGWVLDQTNIPARPKLALVAIANHADKMTGYCWLNAETIAQEAACTPRSVYTFIGALVRNGFIRKQPRRGEDGKQRANDYWILFDREEKDWDWGSRPDETTGDEEAGEIGSSETETGNALSPHEGPSCGAGTEPHEAHDSRQPVDIHAASHGPCEANFTHKRIAEPSKTKPKENRAGARVPTGPPRGYRPPPPQPLGATVEGPAKQIFVYEGSRAWDAWVEYKKKTTGVRWSLSKSHFVDGKHRSGWWFPSLFPPDAPEPTDLTDAEAKEFADTG